MAEMGELLWQPSDARKQNANVTHYINWMANKGRAFADFEELRQWSASDIEGFWSSLADYFELDGIKSTPVLSSHQMPGAKWFEGGKVNFAEYLLEQGQDDAIAIYARTEDGPVRTVSWAQLRTQVTRAAHALKALGIEQGDRVVSYLPNCPEMAVAYLACVSLGAIWSSCAPEFGHASVVDRFSQIDPKLLLTTDGYVFAGKVFDRRTEANEIINALPHLQHIIHVAGPSGAFENNDPRRISWEQFLDKGADSPLPFANTGFNDPLWVVYSSGTTGLPKPFVHGHGGILLEALKFMHFHMNLKPDSTLFYYTTTGWVMWNILMNGLLTGGSIVMYDGAPMTPDKPDILWELAQQTGMTFFGASPTYIAEQEKRDIVPKDRYDVSRIDSILLGGSPVMPEHMEWCLNNLNNDIWVTSQSGGTDIASGFVGASPLLPVHGGEIQTRCLGVDAHAYNDEGEPVIGDVGELVVAKPMPSMPLYFWNDEDGSRYHESYFEEFPGKWRHGDYFKVNERGGCFIMGRSDSTLNRYGVRIGTAEIYRTIEAIDGVEDSLIVNLDLPGGKFFMPLFVTLQEGRKLDDGIADQIRQNLKTQYSPRHVPDQIYEMPSIPYTLTGKKLEVPVRKILAGVDPEKAASKDAMADPAALTPFIEMSKRWESNPPY